MIIIIEILLVAGAFSKSFWLGVFVSGYIFYIEDKYSRIEKQLDTYLTENNRLKGKYNKAKCQIDTFFAGKRKDKPKNNEAMPDWDSVADEIYPYKRHTIVRYDKRFIVMMPNGERLNKMFNSLEEAEEAIDK